jgi:putative transposase
MSSVSSIEVGDEIRLNGQIYAVTALSGDGVRLIDATGAISIVALSVLITDPTLELVAGAARGRPSLRSLDGLPDQVAAQARWWEGHVVEVLTGRRPDAAAGEPVKPEYDVRSRSLRQRELAKLDELHRAGHRIGLTTLKRQRRLYEHDGVWGLVDHRATRPSSPAGQVDQRIVDAVARAISDETDRSTGTVARLRRRTEQIVAAEYGADAPPMPAVRTFYRLVQDFQRQAHLRVGPDPQVTGQAARRAVRRGHRDPARRIDANRLDTAGCPGGP